MKTRKIAAQFDTRTANRNDPLLREAEQAESYYYAVLECGTQAEIQAAEHAFLAVGERVRRAPLD